MRRSASVVAIVITTVLSMGTAFASPPSGDIKFEDWARVQSVDATTIPINAGYDLVSGQYSIPSSGQTGWRELPGTMILLVTKGKMMLHGGEGCAAKEVATGQGTVVGGGVYSVHNAGNEQLDFFGMFLKQAPGSPQPLSEGPTVAAPAGCAGALAESGPAAVSLKTPAAGTFVDAHYTAHHTDFEVKKDLDMFATHYDFGPDSSTGWISHVPALNIVEEGELGYVEAKDGKCDESETYTAGDAFYHPPHRHIAYNRGQSRLKLTVVFFNLPHNETPLPVVGNQATAVDFSQAPPADCIRAR